MKISAKLPVMARVDNVGSIFMAYNITATSCINHVGIRYKHIKEYMIDGIDKILLMKSTENDNDIHTKDLQRELYAKYARKMTGA